MTRPGRGHGGGHEAAENPAIRIWVVDRVEPPVAVLIADDDERQMDVPLRRLPAGLQSGAVLRVPMSDTGPHWEGATADEELRRARLREAEAALARLRRRDPGGDIVL